MFFWCFSFFVYNGILMFSFFFLLMDSLFLFPLFHINLLAC